MSDVGRSQSEDSPGSLGKKKSQSRGSRDVSRQKQRPLSRQQQLNKEDKMGRMSAPRYRRSVRRKVKRGAPPTLKTEGPRHRKSSHLHEPSRHSVRQASRLKRVQMTEEEEPITRRKTALSSKKSLKDRSAAEIQGLLAKLAVNDTEADDDIRRNILLRKQAVGAIADFTCVQKDSVLGKTFLAGGVNKQHPILTLHDLLRQAIDMNGTTMATHKEMMKDIGKVGMIRTAMQNDAGYEFLQSLVIKKQGKKEELNEEWELKYYVHFCREIAHACLKALGNIAAGPLLHAKTLMDEENRCHETLGGIVTRSKDPETVELAVWAMANLASDTFSREKLYNTNILKSIAFALSNTTIEQNVQLYRTSAWAYSNLTRDGVAAVDVPHFLAVMDQYSPVKKLVDLLQLEDEEVILHSCWAMSNLTQSCTENEIEAVLRHGISPRIVELMMHPHLKIQWRSLRTVGNILSGDENEANEVLRFGALTHIKTLMDSHSAQIRRTACFALSNVTAIDDDALIEEALFSDKDTLTRLVRISREDVAEIKREAVFALCNAIVSGNPKQRLMMIRAGCVESFIEMVEGTMEEEQLFLNIMSALLNLLTSANNEQWSLTDLVPTNAVKSQRQGIKSVGKTLAKEQNLVARILHRIDGWNKLEAGKEARDYTDHVLLQDLMKFK